MYTTQLNYFCPFERELVTRNNCWLQEIRLINQTSKTHLFRHSDKKKNSVDCLLWFSRVTKFVLPDTHVCIRVYCKTVCVKCRRRRGDLLFTFSRIPRCVIYTSDTLALLFVHSNRYSDSLSLLCKFSLPYRNYFLRVWQSLYLLFPRFFSPFSKLKCVPKFFLSLLLPSSKLLWGPLFDVPLCWATKRARAFLVHLVWYQLPSCNIT